jgi:ferritin
MMEDTYIDINKQVFARNVFMPTSQILSSTFLQECAHFVYTHAAHDLHMMYVAMLNMTYMYICPCIPYTHVYNIQKISYRW